MLLTSCGPGAAPAQPAVAQASGTVELNQAQPNDVPLGGGGTGTLSFNGTVYRLAISGLGVEGSAVAIVQTSGAVHGLQNIARFPGTYRRTQAAGFAGQTGGLWLQNEYSTVMHLNAPPQGRLPDIGGDAVRVVLDQ